VRVDEGDFLAFLGARAPSGPPEAERCAELFLAFACSRGDAEAVRTLEERYMPAVVRQLERRAPSPGLAQEALQSVREILYVAPPGRTAKIADYAGTGPLAGFLRIIASRVMLRSMQKEERFVPLGEQVAARVAEQHDAELAIAKRRYGAELQSALQESYRACSAEDRSLLCYRYVEGCSVDQLAAIHRVHRATAARWLRRAEETMIGQCLRTLRERLGVNENDLMSVLRLIRSQLQLSVQSAFRTGSDRKKL
jgi:RNA polymerase sigma-70 factor (ECF subfamily)